MIQSTHNQNLKTGLERRILELVSDRNIRRMETARDRYAAAFGRQPYILYELVLYGYLPFVPEMPVGGSYFIDAETREILHSVLGGKLDLHLSDSLSSTVVTLKEKR
jgi:hypothetical protein